MDDEFSAISDKATAVVPPKRITAGKRVSRYLGGVLLGAAIQAGHALVSVLAHSWFHHAEGIQDRTSFVPSGLIAWAVCLYAIDASDDLEEVSVHRRVRLAMIVGSLFPYALHVLTRY